MTGYQQLVLACFENSSGLISKVGVFDQTPERAVDGYWLYPVQQPRPRIVAEYSFEVPSRAAPVFLNVEPEVARNEEYYDHDTDDVKNIHCLLRIEPSVISI
jgi:hypothetical protein